MKKITRKEYKLKFKTWKEINVSRKKTTPLRKTICMLHIKILEMFLLVTIVIARHHMFRNSLKKTEQNLWKSRKE